MAINEIRNGVQILAKNSNAQVTARAEQTGATVTQDAHGRYQEAVLQGNVYTAANTAVQALSLNSATATGLVLSNPAGSGKNLVLLKVDVALASLPAGQSNLILTANTNPSAAATVHTTPITPKNCLLGGATGVGLVDSAATLPVAPTILKPITGVAATVAASTSFPPLISVDIGGEYIVAPGCTISLQCLTTAISVVAGFTWEEVSL
jgi:hypothetical protein